MPSSAAQSRAQPRCALLRRVVPLRHRGHALLPPLRLRKSTPRLRLGVRSAVDLFFPENQPHTAREFPCARSVEPRLHRQSTSPSTLRGPLVRPSPLVSILGTPSFFCTHTRAPARSEPHSPAHHHCSEPPPPPHPCLRATPGPANATSE